MAFYIVPKTSADHQYFNANWPLKLTMSGRVQLCQEVFDYMCKSCSLKNPMIRLDDHLMLSDTQNAFTWTVADGVYGDGFEIEAVLNSSCSPNDCLMTVAKPLIDRYLKSSSESGHS